MIDPVLPVVLVGTVSPLGPGGPPSGIDKLPARGPWRIGSTGIEGDAQGDLRNHGGPEKAIHQYPLDHHAAWAIDIGDHPLLSRPGAFGENLATNGWTERDVCIGDVARFGGATLQVSQGRQPCFKLDRRFGRTGMARAVQTTGRTGWYWRVLEAGTAEPGNKIVIVERPRPDWPLTRLIRLFYVDTRNREELEAVADLSELAEGWRALARRRLESGATEDWSRRLTGVEMPAT